MVRVNFGQIKEWFDAVLGVSFGVKKIRKEKNGSWKKNTCIYL